MMKFGFVCTDFISQNSTGKIREQEPAETAKARTSSSSSQEGGSVLIDKKYEPLEATVRAYESRVEAQLDLPYKLRQYPNAREEKAQLEANCQ